MINMCNFNITQCGDGSSNTHTDHDVVVDLPSNNVLDLKYYAVTLIFSIVTMLVLKAIWNLTKLISIHLIKSLEDLNISSKLNDIKRSKSASQNIDRSALFEPQPKGECRRRTSSNNINYDSVSNGTRSRSRSRLNSSSCSSLTNLNINRSDSVKSPNASDLDLNFEEIDLSFGSKNQNQTTIVAARSDSEMSTVEKGDQINRSDTTQRKVYAFGIVFTLNLD